jgi:hypothetical protein
MPAREFAPAVEDVAEAAPVGFAVGYRIGLAANDPLLFFKRSQAEG